MIAGRVLDHLGYRNDGKATDQAFEDGIASNHQPNSWTPYPVTDWHSERVAQLVRDSSLEQRKAVKRAPKPQLVALRGDTYAHRDAIRAAGGKWNSLHKVWYVPADQYEALQRLIAGSEHGKEA